MIKVILWDLDQTVLDFRRSEFCALKKAFSHFCIGELDCELHRSYSEINQACWLMLEQERLTKEQVMSKRFEDFFKKHDIVIPVQPAEFSVFYEDCLPDTIAFVDYANETLNFLKGKVKQLVVTNGAAAVQHKRLEKSGLDEIFDGVFISDEIGFEKPNEKFFVPVLDEAQRYANRDEIVIIGDSLTSDMRGGMNAGIKTCWFNPNGLIAPEEYRIDYQIKRIDDVINEFELW